MYKVFAPGGEVTIDSIKVPYLIYGGLFVVLAIVVWLSQLPKFTNEEKLERGLGLSVFTSAFWAALGTGLFNLIMWSNIFTLAIKDLKQYTSQGSSFLVMMIVGGALVPLLMGCAADERGIQHAFAVPVVCYVYIAFYGFFGYRVKQVQST